MICRNILVMIIAIVCLASECNDKYIRFESPLPDKVENEPVIPDNYTGKYFRTSRNFEDFLKPDSIYLNINEKIILSVFVITERIAKTDFDTMQNLTIRNGLIYDLEEDDSIGYPYNMVNDSLEIKNTLVDTIFNINQDDIARYYKKTLYLNKKVSKYFEVSKLDFNSKTGILHFNHIQDSLDTDLLKQITKLKEVTSYSDSIENKTIDGYIVHLSKRKLKKFIKMGGFTKHETYQKIN